jgi:hypothetical protein
VEIALLRQVACPAGSGPIRLASRGRLAAHLQQVGAHCIQAVIFSQSLVGCQHFKSLKAAGCAISHCDGDGMIQPMIGLSEICNSNSQSALICGQSVASALAASSCRAAIAA